MKDYPKNPWATPFAFLSILTPAMMCIGAFSIICILLAPYSQKSNASTLTETAVEKASATITDIPLQAKAAYVFDVKEQRVLFAKNEEAQLPLASITKIMTAMVARDIIPEYTTIGITADALSGSSSPVIAVGERWHFKDILDLTLMMSSNDGASSIAGVAGSLILGIGQDATGTAYRDAKNAFVTTMNEKAKTLGLIQTYFLNETGLDQTTEISGGYGSARDVATMLSYGLKTYPDIFTATRESALKFAPENGKPRVAVNTDTLVSSLPGLLASKTGFTDLAGGNLAVAFDASFGHPIIVVVLGSTETGRFTDVQSLIAATINSFSPPQQ